MPNAALSSVCLVLSSWPIRPADEALDSANAYQQPYCLVFEVDFHEEDGRQVSPQVSQASMGLTQLQPWHGILRLITDFCGTDATSQRWQCCRLTLSLLVGGYWTSRCQAFTIHLQLFLDSVQMLFDTCPALNYSILVSFKAQAVYTVLHLKQALYHRVKQQEQLSRAKLIGGIEITGSTFDSSHCWFTVAIVLVDIAGDYKGQIYVWRISTGERLLAFQHVADGPKQVVVHLHWIPQPKQIRHRILLSTGCESCLEKICFCVLYKVLEHTQAYTSLVLVHI